MLEYRKYSLSWFVSAPTYFDGWRWWKMCGMICNQPTLFCHSLFTPWKYVLSTPTSKRRVVLKHLKSVSLSRPKLKLILLSGCFVCGVFLPFYLSRYCPTKSVVGQSIRIDLTRLLQPFPRLRLGDSRLGRPILMSEGEARVPIPSPESDRPENRRAL